MTARGDCQARELARRLQELFPTATGLYSSPLGRAQQTAKIIAERLELSLLTVPDLREFDVGALEGQPLSSVDLSPLVKDDDFAFEGGESTRNYSTRTARAVRELADAHAGQTILVVGHGMALAGALALLLGTEPLFGHQYILRNAGFAELRFDPSPRLGAIELR